MCRVYQCVVNGQRPMPVHARVSQRQLLARRSKQLEAAASGGVGCGYTRWGRVVWLIGMVAIAW